MASRMESNSEVGRIQMSAISCELLRNRSLSDFDIEERGYIDVKVIFVTSNGLVDIVLFREKENN